MLLKGDMPTYTVREEKLNFYTHIFGAVIALIGSIFVVAKAIKKGGTGLIISMVVYGLSLMVMYVLSTIYHSAKTQEQRKKLQKCDHASISILVAGCDTAFLAGGVGTKTAYILCATCWALGIFAMIFNIINVRKYRALTMTSYIVTGIAPLILLFPLYRALGPIGFSLLLVGGLLFLSGLTFYAIHKEYFHSIWHLFVLAGTAVHYFAILFFIV